MVSTQKPTIGLMGGPGSGKSLVASQMASMGCVVIDADDIAKKALETDEIKRQLVAWWGGQVLKSDGRIARSKLAQIVFSDASERDRLESLIHPMVHAQLAVLKAQAWAQPGTRAVVEDCPLLLETGIDKECDVLVLVDASFQTRLERVARTRGWAEAELRRRDKCQVSLDIKRQRADYVISNDADEAHCLEQTRRVLSQIIP